MHSLPSLHCHLLPAAGCRLPCSFALVALDASRAHARLPGWTMHSVLLKWMMGLWLMGLIRLSPSSGTKAFPNWPIAGPPSHLCPHYALPALHSLSSCRFGVSLRVYPCCLRFVYSLPSPSLPPLSQSCKPPPPHLSRPASVCCAAPTHAAHL
jgi:hypothetical protein